MVKNPLANAGDTRDLDSIPGLGQSPGGGHGNPLQYSCLKNPMDEGAWRAVVHRVAKGQTRLKHLSMHILMQVLQKSSVRQREGGFWVFWTPQITSNA